MPVDPFTILGGVGAAAGIIVTITRTVKHLSELQTKYSEAEMSIRQLIRQLMSIKYAIQQIQEWTELNLARTPRERELVEAFEISFEGCKEAMEAMAEEVAKLVQDGLAGDKRTMRARYVWNEETMKDHQQRLDSQVQALQLLLSAVHCQTASEQTALLREPQNRQIVEKVRDDTSTLRAASIRNGSFARTTSVLSSGNYTIGSTEFDMDNSIVNTDVYRRAMAHQRARSADERIRRSQEHIPGSPDRPYRLSPDSGFVDGSESSDLLSPIDARFNRRFERPRPYERSVASSPADIPRQFRRSPVNNNSASDTFLPGLNVTMPGRNKLTKKRSFLPSIFTGSSTSLVSSNQDSLRTPNHRRGRRHSDTDIHRSIDLNSIEGRSAPPLVQAAQSGSGIEIEELLDQGAHIESQHSTTKRTALSVASHCGNDDVVAILLQHGSNPRTMDKTGMTPLHLAASRGHYRVVEYLLKEDVDVDARGPDKKTPLRLAADDGHVEVVDLLLSQRAKVNARDAQNLTALHSAARLGDEEIAQLLIHHRADIEAKDGSFRAAIHHASERGHDRIVDLLLARKADIEALGEESKSPLTTACAAGSTDVVRLLLQRKASAKHKGAGSMTPLHWASYNGHSDVVDMLLEKKVTIDPRTNDGRTPLHLAVMTDNFATAELLLRKGAAMEAQCQDLIRPIHYASQCSDTGILNLLLEFGANIEAETRLGKRPLHYATSHGNPANINFLLQRNALIDARDGAGDRPLCLASAEGNVDAVRLLLDRGAEMRTRYSKGPSHEDSPLCVATKNGHLPVVEEFIQRGASVRQRDEANWQPLRYAAYYGHPDLVQYLLACGAPISGLEAPGSFGFNLTATRIGFAPNSNIDEFRRQSVLMLLQEAESRDQETRTRDLHTHSGQYPLQDAPAEKADDQNAGENGPYRPVAERQELPVHGKSPRIPFLSSDNSTNTEGRISPREQTYAAPADLNLPRPGSPPPFTLANRNTPEFRQQYRANRPSIPPPPPPSARLVSPLPSESRYESSRSPRIISPLPSRARDTSNSPPRPSTVPQSPSRAPPPPPLPQLSRGYSTTESNISPRTSPYSPPPTRAAPLPPDLPPIPDPNEAIVVCDDCSNAGRNTTDLACPSCRRALYMYHHIMSGDNGPAPVAATITSHDRPPIPQAQIYELA